MKGLRGTRAERYGFPVVYRDIDDEGMTLIQNGEGLYDEYLRIGATALAEKLNCTHTTIGNYLKQHGYSLDRNGSPYIEQKIETLLESLNIEFIKRARPDFMNRKELDFLFLHIILR